MNQNVLGNLNTFIGKSNNIMLISDFEGYAPGGMIEKAKKHLKNPNNRLIFLGDVADYTFIGDILKHSDNGIQRQRFCYLEMINLINNHTNAISVIGNRDINKLKLVPLLEIDGQPTWWKSQNPTNDNILEIAKTLKTNINNGTWKWKITDLSPFYPYWNQKNAGLKCWKGWDTYPTSLKHRFDAIFGRDPVDGTMSAQNTIVGLPIELGLYNDETKNDNELLSAIVFTAYARMLDISLYQKQSSNNTTRFGFNTNLDGVLAYYLTTNLICGYFIRDKNVFLFSHGGFHSDYTGEYDIKQEVFKTIKSQESIDEAQKGGQINTFNKINDFNRDFNQKINNVINKKPSSDNDLDLLLALGANVDGNEHITGMTKKSPIMPRHIDHLGDNKPLFTNTLPNISSENVYNIYGHSPNGFAYTFAIGNNGQKIINCDFSNSLYKSYQYLDPETYDNNNLVLYFNPTSQDNNKYFTLDGSLHFKEGINISQNFKINESLASKLDLSHAFEIKYSVQDSIMILPKSQYHGIATINDKRVYLYNEPVKNSFQKFLVINPVQTTGGKRKRKATKKRTTKKRKSNKKTRKNKKN
jgi:hypothetical protein